MTSNSIFKLTFVALAVGAILSAFAQYNPNIQQNFQSNQNAGFQDAQNYQQNYQNEQASKAAGMVSAAASAAATYQNPSAQFLQSSAPANTFGQSGSGYTNDGTLMMGGQRIGNPHQILHDAEVPSLIGITAVRYSFTDVPSYGQGTLTQIQTDMANAPITNDPTRMFSRLYLTTANPYTQGVATPHNNYQTYQGILTSASAASYQLTAADDGKMYAFKTLSAPNQQSMNILIKELPNTSQFKGSSDLKGGATGVHVTQNGDAAALSAYMSTLKPYDFSWRAALAPYANDPNTGAFVANWVMGSHQVQAYQLGMQNQSMQTGNEAFGVLAWDANQNKYVMLDPTNQQATAGSVTGNMPTLGNNQFGFFGMHTHPGSATPSGQDYAMTQQLGLDQMVIGTNGAQAIFANNPSNNWQGAGFLFEGPIESNPTGGNKINAANSSVGQGNGLFRSRSGGKHDGIDISGQTKDDVKAAGSGTVVYSGWQNGYGQTIVVDHGNGRYTLYAHLDNKEVKVGQEVAAGETIGGVGTTGNTPGGAQTHLHFEIRDGKNDPKHAVDPLPILPGPYFQDGTLVSPNYVSPYGTGPYYTPPTYGSSSNTTSGGFDSQAGTGGYVQTGQYGIPTGSTY